MTEHGHDQKHDHQHPKHHDTAPLGAGEAKDPVCGMSVAKGPETRHVEHDGETYWFCSENCETKFKADPFYYASGRAAGQEEIAVAGSQYTCPMHPEIVRDAPGECPICGMALEPIVPSDEPSGELGSVDVHFSRMTVAAIAMKAL